MNRVGGKQREKQVENKNVKTKKHNIPVVI